MQSIRICKVDNCCNKHAAHGYCYNHYRKARRRGEFGMCSVDKCDRGKDRGGMCLAHYTRLKRGQPLDGEIIKHWLDDIRESIESGDDKSVMVKIEARCDKDVASGCWNYFRANGKGYGELSAGKGRTILVHRLVARIMLPEFKDELQVHHKCANRKCCNPEHLQVLTSRENRAEMLERNTYINRIRALEEALGALDSKHHLLN